MFRSLTNIYHLYLRTSLQIEHINSSMNDLACTVLWSRCGGRQTNGEMCTITSTDADLKLCRYESNEILFSGICLKTLKYANYCWLDNSHDPMSDKGSNLTLK